jgi:hypothetical protein
MRSSSSTTSWTLSYLCSSFGAAYEAMPGFCVMDNVCLPSYCRRQPTRQSRCSNRRYRMWRRMYLPNHFSDHLICILRPRLSACKRALPVLAGNGVPEVAITGLDIYGGSTSYHPTACLAVPACVSIADIASSVSITALYGVGSVQHRLMYNSDYNPVMPLLA